MYKKELEKLSRNTVISNNFKININVNDEKDLYNSFDKYNETLSEDLISYINDKNELLNLKESILIEIISTIGSFSIWESANSWFIERKVIRLNKLKLLRLKNSKISFKYETI